MKSYDNVYQFDRLLRKARVPVPLEKVMEALECSKSTVMRLVAEMRDKFHAPIEHCNDHPRGYRYTEGSYELPGIWFSLIEIQALLLLLTLLQAFNPDLLSAALAPMRRKLASFLRKLGLTADARSRIRILRVAARPVGPAFQPVATALLQRQQLNIRYFSRSTGEITERDISPQRLTHYRDNWYLDAWCHKREAVRTFSVDCIAPAKVLDRRAIEIPTPQLDRELGASYGLFSGEPVAIARLRFTPERAVWVAPEQWHPEQKSHREPSGHYVLEVPYSSSHELVLDICRYGPDVEVLAPLELRQAVAQRHRAAAAQYEPAH